jgi:hypothetical protein
MARLMKFFLSALLALALLLASVAGALAWWLSGDGPRERVQALASESLGVPVALSSLSLSIFPWPSVAVGELKIATQAPVTAERIELRPAWPKLLGLGGAPRELEVESMTLRGLSLPQKGLDQLSFLLLKKEQSAQQIRQLYAQDASKKENKQTEAAAVIIGLLAIPQRTQLDGVVWQSSAGELLSVSGDLSLSASRDQMDVSLQLAGGEVSGTLRLASMGGKSGWQLRGELVTRSVDLTQLPGARQRLAGRFNGTTTLDAAASQFSGIGAALQTNTPFNVSGAVIKGIDLAKAVSALGLSRGGETALQQLSGTLTTRGTNAPMRITLSDLQASSSLLKASGAVSVGAAASPGAPRALSGKVSVDLTAGNSQVGQVVGQWVGIPLEISGTTVAPVVAPTRGAMIGGALGSVMAPVIGTGAGAKMGDRVGEKLSGWKDKLFGK